MKGKKLIYLLTITTFMFSATVVLAGKPTPVKEKHTNSPAIKRHNKAGVLVDPAVLEKTAPKEKKTKQHSKSGSPEQQHNKAAGIIEPVLFR